MKLGNHKGTNVTQTGVGHSSVPLNFIVNRNEYQTHVNLEHHCIDIFEYIVLYNIIITR